MLKPQSVERQMDAIDTRVCVCVCKNVDTSTL